MTAEPREGPRPSRGNDAGLTARQSQVLDLVKERLERDGHPPTMRELASALGLASTGGVVSALNSLEKKGFIKRRPGSARSISLTRRGRSLPGTGKTVEVPVLTFHPPAGSFWEGHPEGVVRLDRRLVGERKTAALPLPGDLSFRGVEIGSGYFILEQGRLKPGAVFALDVDGILVAGPVFRSRKLWRLYDILTGDEVILSRDSTDFEVLGRVVNLIFMFGAERQV
jgi:SOS-response transcriptional repressor LexA